LLPYRAPVRLACLAKHEKGHRVRRMVSVGAAILMSA
jgi:hypothetical protein